MGRVLRVAALVGLLAASPAAAQEEAEKAEEREPGPQATGKLLSWKSKGGLPYEYAVPAGYDPARGANLVFILHGTGLDRRWGFANHRRGEFRPDDIVVSPDGPTPSGGARLWANESDDVRALHDLQEELGRAFKVRQVYVYGHSQGAFFAFLYASTYPGEVAGAVGQAGGVWKTTPVNSRNRNLPLVFLHGTADPVVPYSNSRGGYDWLRDQGYVRCHFRAMEGWNHWPSPFHASQQIAWIEGTTTTDPERIAASLDHFGKVAEKEWIDFSAWYAVARRAAALEGAPEDLRKRGAADAASLEALAAKHAEAIRAAVGKEGPDRAPGKPWIGRAARFLRDFEGVPAREALAKEWAATLDRHREKAVAALKEHYRVRENDARKAFESGVRAVRDGFLHYECSDPAFLDSLAAWEREAAKWRLDPAAVKAYAAVVPPFREALDRGWKDYLEANRAPRSE
jgi:predicted esterase